MTLKFVDPKAAPATLNILLYSPPKQGKTTAALSAPGPILHLNSEGANAVRFARRKHGNEKIHEIEVTSGAVLNDVLLHLRGKPAERTVVVDTIGSMYSVLLEEKAKGGKPTLPQYGDVNTAIERFVKELRDLPVNMVVLCHDVPIKDESTGVIERLPFTGTNNPALGGKLMAWVDVIGYCGRAADGKYLATLVDANGRRGGDRTNTLGQARELNLEEWITTAALSGREEKKAA